MTLQLGCIADDFTGATDVANEIQQQGLRTLLLLGVPQSPLDLSGIEGIVIAQKTRTAPVAEAIAESLDALSFLQKQNGRHFYYKYCSTFDSSEQGNIGPVTDALLDALNLSFTLVTPAFPRTGRTVFQGHLFVGDQLLSESPMRHHPLTPMTDSNLVRLMERQSQGKAALIPHATVRQGVASIAAAFHEAESAGCRYAVVDAIADEDLQTIGQAALQTTALSTGASGLAYGLARALRHGDDSNAQRHRAALPRLQGPAAVLAGSCSHATRGQVEAMKETCPSFFLDVMALADGQDIVSQAIEWAVSHWDEAPVLLYSSLQPDRLRGVQDRIGASQAGELAERAFSRIAKALVDRGLSKLIVAGGETSGAVVNALGIEALRIGLEIDPGVPWTVPVLETPLLLALKSGNFGAVDFFAKALRLAQE